MTYRFRDGMGESLAERDFPDHAAALAWAATEDEFETEIQRVEYRGPDGDWRWAGPLLGGAAVSSPRAEAQPAKCHSLLTPVPTDGRTSSSVRIAAD
ncbi:MAG: hypothetical protein JWM79_3823 [Nocardioides sp.]|nr:hypothetical protein [Nocardioides sp.]